MTIQEATNAQQWDAFLGTQRFRPFLQSWTMGEVYKELGQEPIRLEVRDGDRITGICMALLVPARRGKHLSIPYGPVLTSKEALQPLLEELRTIATTYNCSFIRMSPFTTQEEAWEVPHAKQSPLHLLAEHIWYIPLTQQDKWIGVDASESPLRSEEDILMGMRKTTRNLVRRAEKDGVTIEASVSPLEDLQYFLALHDETRKRHGFTPYTDAFFRAQVEHFSKRNECTLYLARYQGEVIAASIHMHAFGETSYHHGASSHEHRKIPASYLLQWRAIQDAMKRGDHVYNFWGISPEGATKHPFAGVRLFKTGFGGELLNLSPCVDIPLSSSYKLTRAFEIVRKWRRGF